MRIRKRQVPFPLSYLSPVPLSDPQLSRSPEVQLCHQKTTHPKHSHPQQNLSPGRGEAACVHAQPSDQSNQRAPDLRTMIGGGSTAWGCPAAAQEQKEKEKLRSELGGEELELEDKRLKDGERSNDTRKGGIWGAESSTALLPLRSFRHPGGGGWCEGDKKVPLKKRIRGSFETIMEKGRKQVKSKMKTQTNKRCARRNDDDDDGQEGKEAKEGFDNSGTKKRARGGALMEGSRCSRVNGRGWRCCQQTLVGYSLCEHHLGKSRLRSMSSVRSRAMAALPPKKDDSSCLIVSNTLSQLGDGEEDERNRLMIPKRRMRIGTVKARSLSSLLGQTTHSGGSVAVADTVKN